MTTILSYIIKQTLPYFNHSFTQSLHHCKITTQYLTRQLVQSFLFSLSIFLRPLTSYACTDHHFMKKVVDNFSFITTFIILSFFSPLFSSCHNSPSLQSITSHHTLFHLLSSIVKCTGNLLSLLLRVAFDRITTDQLL